MRYDYLKNKQLKPNCLGPVAMLLKRCFGTELLTHLIRIGHILPFDIAMLNFVYQTDNIIIILRFAVV